MDNLLGFAGRQGVDRFVSVASAGYPSEAQMRRFGRVQRIGGVFVAPACNEASLAKRDLTPFVEAAAEQSRSGSTISYCHNTSFYQLSTDVYPAGALTGATKAPYVAGKGLTCDVPAGYSRHGFAAEDLGVPANTYPFYAP
jgi:hypothetical protein